MGTQVTVVKLPFCDFCDFCGQNGLETTAEYDFRTVFGPWANGCEAHYLQHRATTALGTGNGQKLVVA